MTAARTGRSGLWYPVALFGLLLATRAGGQAPENPPARLSILGKPIAVPLGAVPAPLSGEDLTVPHVPAAPPEAPEGATIQPTSAQQPPARGDEQDLLLYQVPLIPPGPQRLFQLESEDAWRERLRQESRRRPTTVQVEFPPEGAPMTREPYSPRHWPMLFELVEPNYVCYRRLLFEQKNSERYGWDVGILQPFLSAGHFYADVVTLPLELFTWPCRPYECSAGYCLPGDPVPLLLYPPLAGK
jgi:hypothetical protein